MIHHCRSWVNGTQCELPPNHDGKHRTTFPSGGGVVWCEFCGGKQWLQAADVYRQIGHDARPDWELAATVPCFACSRKAS